MQATQPQPRADLRTLKRAGGEASQETHIPRPRFNWKTRILLPGAILLALLLLLAYAARDSLLPAKPVTVVPVVLKDVAGATAISANGASAPAAATAGGVQ